MENLFAGIGIGLALFLPCAGIAAMFHGFKIVEINHYHGGHENENTM